MKKNFLKIVSMVAALVLAVGVLGGCGGGADNTNEDAKGDDKTEATQKGNEDSLQVLTMATNAEFKPFEYLEGEKIVGADIDIANVIADRLGYKLEISNIDFDAALTGVVTGKYDIAVAGITATEERKPNMNFTNSYFKASQSIIVKSGSAIKGKADLKGKTIACQEGT